MNPNHQPQYQGVGLSERIVWIEIYFHNNVGAAIKNPEKRLISEQREPIFQTVSGKPIGKERKRNLKESYNEGGSARLRLVSRKTLTIRASRQYHDQKIKVLDGQSRRIRSYLVAASMEI